MTPDSRRSLLPDAISRISKLEIRARPIVEGFLSGLHRSPYFGQSVEFVQHREYVPGDDIRKIDWKVWSKTDRYYIKQYEEDTNLRTTLLVDLSESMLFGSGPMTNRSSSANVRRHAQPGPSRHSPRTPNASATFAASSSRRRGSTSGSAGRCRQPECRELLSCCPWQAL